MSSTFYAENINVSDSTRVNEDIIFKEATNDLTLAVADQVTGVATATIPDLGGVSQDLVLTSQTQTLTNKTIGDSTILSTTEVADSGDNTKQVAFDISGATGSTATTLDFNQTANRTVTFVDDSGTLAMFDTTAGVPGADNAVLRSDGTTGEIQGSAVTLAGAGDNEFSNVLSVTGVSGSDLTLTATTGQDMVLAVDSGQNVTVTGGGVTVAENLAVSGDATITGDLTVNGTTTSVNSNVVTIADNNLLLSSNYTTAAARAGGLTVNYLPTATTASVSLGGFASPLTVNAAGGSFAANDLILVSDANTESNNGIYQVVSYADPLITISASPVGNFLQSMFTTDTTVAGTITKVNLAVLQAGTDGRWEVASGSDSTAISFTDLALVSELPSGTWTEVDVATTDATPNASTTFASTSDRSITFELVYSAKEEGASNALNGKITRCFHNVAGTASAMGAGSRDESVLADGSNWSITVTASGANIVVTVTGEAATNVDWRLLYRATESPAP